MSNTASATPTSPPHASADHPAICSRAYFTVTPAARRPRRYTTPEVARMSLAVNVAPVAVPRRPPSPESGTTTGSEP